MEISRETIATEVAHLEGCTVHPTEEWWEWSATIERGEDMLVLKMTLMGDGYALWGGFDAESTAARLLGEVAEELRQALPGVWLHDPDCMLWSPTRYLTKYG